MKTLDYAIPVSHRSRFGRDVGFALSLVCYLSGAIAISLLVSAYASFISASIYLGRFPSYGRPDPKTLTPAAMAPMSIVIPAAMLLPALVAFLAFRMRHRRPNLPWIAAIVFGFGTWALLIALIIVDPFGVFEWIFD